MLKTKQSQDTTDTLRQKLIISQENTYVLSRYRAICREIMGAFQSGMSYIPFSEWIAELDENKFVEDRNEEINKLVQSLKNDLKNLAEILDYTYEDDKGFLINKERLNNNILRV